MGAFHKCMALYGICYKHVVWEQQIVFSWMTKGEGVNTFPFCFSPFLQTLGALAGASFGR